MTIKVGTIIDHRYTVLDVVGAHGGMGCVYRVRDQFENVRALKVYDPAPEFLKSIKSNGVESQQVVGHFRKQFIKEAQTLRKITEKTKGARFARVYDLQPEGETPYYVMDYVVSSTGSPKSFRDRIDELRCGDSDSPTPDQIKQWFIELAEQLAFLHENGFVHRDIKPANILLDKDNHAVLIDFGLIEEVTGATRCDDSMSMPQNFIVGSGGYIAPELKHGGKISAKADSFALGAVFWELLTNGDRFQLGYNYSDFIEGRMDDPEFVECWQSIFKQLLAASPDDRCGDLRGLYKSTWEEETRACPDETGETVGGGKKHSWKLPLRFGAVAAIATTFAFVFLLKNNNRVTCVAHVIKESTSDNSTNIEQIATSIDLDDKFREKEVTRAIGLLYGVTNKGNSSTAITSLTNAMHKGSLRAQFAYSLYLLGIIRNTNVTNTLLDKPGPDVSAGLKLLRKTAETTNITNDVVRSAQNLLSDILEDGSFGSQVDPVESFMWRERAANSGDPDSQCQLAKYYLEGRIVSRDVEKGFALAKASAALGNAKGLLALGGCYMEGLGTTTNYIRAVECCEKALQLGNIQAMYCLASCYRKGLGVQKDHDKADALLKKAATLGNGEAQLAWGLRLCQLAQGNAPDKSTNAVEATRWINAAASNDVLKATQFIQSCRDPIHYTQEARTNSFVQVWKASHMNDPDAVQSIHSDVQSKKLTLDLRFLDLYAKAEHPMAEFLLGDDIAKTNVQASIDYLRRAYNHGNPFAASKLMELVSLTNLVGLTTNEYMSMCVEAATAGNAEAQLRLGVSHLCHSNEPYAVSWFRKSALKGNAIAQCQLGISLLYGRGCQKDEKEAVAWLQISASNGCAVAMATLGEGHEQGEWGLEKDIFNWVAD